MAIPAGKRRLVVTVNDETAAWLAWEAKMKSRSVSWMIGHYIQLARAKYDKGRSLIENPITKKTRKRKEPKQ